jgi:hypothetical protein
VEILTREILEKKTRYHLENRFRIVANNLENYSLELLFRMMGLKLKKE